jgi:hypothetical protein
MRRIEGNSKSRLNFHLQPATKGGSQTYNHIELNSSHSLKESDSAPEWPDKKPRPSDILIVALWDLGQKNCISRSGLLTTELSYNKFI